MGNFRGGGDRGGFGGKPRFGGGRSFGGGRPDFRGGDRGGDRENMMHSTTCSECKKICEVPFRPTSGKPVYCKDCFGRREPAREDRGGSYAPRRDFNDRPRPSFDQPRRFESAPHGAPVNANADIKKQLDVLTSKIEKLASIVEALAKKELPATPVKAKVEAPVKVTEEKPKKAKKAAKK
ncbi:MAG: CxxC-x17-CxxC domain-containing protein [Minisyncoccia bacterium]